MKSTIRKQGIAVMVALTVIGMFVALALIGFSTPSGNANYDEYRTIAGCNTTESSISQSLGNVTDTVIDMFGAVLPLMVVVVVVGGLMGAFPQMFKFDF